MAPAPNSEAEPASAELVKQSGETKPEAVVKAPLDQLSPVHRARSKVQRVDELEEIAKHCANLPVLDDRPTDEILGYDEQGRAR